MKSNWLTNGLLAACLIVLIGGQISNKSQAAIQPARAAGQAVNIDAPLAPQATSGSISISAVAFQPASDGFDFDNSGLSIFGLRLLGSSGCWFVAPVNLPQGAIVDEVVCYMKDSNPAVDGECRLGFNLLGIEDFQTMAQVFTSGSSGSLVAYEENAIDYDHVNNELNAYGMLIIIPYFDSSHYVSFHGAKIHYHFNAVYLPSVSK